MARRTLTGTLVMAPAVLALAATALAAPARTVKIGNGVYTQKWEGTGSGVLATQDLMDEVGCQPAIHECDDTLIEVTEAGTLTIKTSNGPSPPWTPANDTDLQIFASNAQGEVKDELQESAQPTPTSEELVSVRVRPGFFIARIDFAICAQCTVPGEATLKPTAPAAPGPGPAPPAQDTPPSVTAAKPGSRNVRTFKGTASDKEGVAKVEIGILKLEQKGKCRDLTASGKTKAHKGQCTQPNIWITAKGTTSWTYSFKKALKKGRYVLFARATDTSGQTQGGYGRANRKAFTVKK